MALYTNIYSPVMITHVNIIYYNC